MIVLRLPVTFALLLAGSVFCSAQDTPHPRITILHTNDEHSNLIAHPSVDYHPDRLNPALGGFARLAGAAGAIRERKSQSGEPVLLLSGGDFVGGPLFGWLVMRDQAAELSLMQSAGYDAVTIGNHEFDYGSDRLARYLHAAGYPEAHRSTTVLGTNLIIPEDHPLSEMEIRRTQIMKLENGLTVGLLGLIGEDAAGLTAFPDPVEFDNPVEAARRAVSELQDENVDIIIAVTHAGVKEDVHLAGEVPGIDVIVGGHSHTPLYEPLVEGKTLIVQAGSYLRYLGMLELEYDRAEKRVRMLNPATGTPHLMKLDDSVEEDAEMAAKVRGYEQILNELVSELTAGGLSDIRKHLAVTGFPLKAGPPKREANLGNFIADAMRVIAEEVTGERVYVAVQANGVIRSDLPAGSMPWSEDRVNAYDMLGTVGLGSGLDDNAGFPMVSIYLTEDELRRVMEISILLSELLSDVYYLQYSGIRMQYDPGRTLWLRIPVSGTPLPSYRSVLNAELFSGEGLQRGEDYEPLLKGEERLLHIVTDYYVAGFLPVVGDILPNLALKIRDEQGNPAELDERVIQTENGELKVWDAVYRYVMLQDRDEEGLAVIPDYYRTAGDRLVIVSTIPFRHRLFGGLLLIAVSLIWYLQRRQRNQRRENARRHPST